MDFVKLNRWDKLISSFEISFIKKYINDYYSIFVLILVIPFLYVSLFFVFLLISHNLIKKYKMYMDFQSSSEYRSLRLLYDFTTKNREKIINLFDDIKKESKILYYSLYPLKLSFFRVNKYEIEAMKRFKALDSPNREGSLFRSLTEQEMWERRPSAYEYKL
jgi:hypothetical protein